jgi:hypothetical protein
MLGEPRSSLLERALEALPAAPARGAHGLALPSLDELVDVDRWLLVAPDVGALSHCARTLRFSRASRSGQSRRRGRKSKTCAGRPSAQRPRSSLSEEYLPFGLVVFAPRRRLGLPSASRGKFHRSPAPQQVTDSSSTSSRPTFGADVELLRGERRQAPLVVRGRPHVSASCSDPPSPGRYGFGNEPGP